MKLPIPKGRRAILVMGLPLGLAAAGAIAFMALSPATPVAPVPAPKDGQHGVMLALDDRVINLQVGPTGTFRYAKIGVTVELRPSTAGFYELTGEERAKVEKEELDKHKDSVPLLLDAIGQVVSSHDAATLSAVDGRGKLKQEILDAMRARVGDDRLILDIYFTDLVMQ